VLDRSRTVRQGAVWTIAAIALVAAGAAEAGKPQGGDDRIDAIWQRKAEPVVVPAGVTLAQLLVPQPNETPLEAGAREMLAGSLGLIDVVELAIDDLEVRFYLTGGQPLIIPIRRKVQAGGAAARTETFLEWEGPVLVLRRTIGKSVSSVERLYVASDGTLHVDLEWTGSPAKAPIRVATVYNRLSSGYQ